jgi:hypothetical protein
MKSERQRERKERKKAGSRIKKTSFKANQDRKSEKNKAR